MSALRRIGALAWLNLTELFRDRSGLIMLIALPLLLTTVFGAMMGGGERKAVVAVSDADQTDYSTAAIEALDQRTYDFLYAEEPAARRMVSEGQAAVAVVVPVGFGDDLLTGIDTTVTLVIDPRSNTRMAVAESLRGRVQRLSADAQTIRIVRSAFRDAGGAISAQPAPDPEDIYTYADALWSPDPPVDIEEVEVSASAVRGESQGAVGFQQYSLGFTLMFMIFMAFGSAGGFLEERENGTLARLLTTPSSKVTLVVGKVLGIYATVIMEAAIMIVFGVALFNVPWGNDPLAVAMIIGSYALAVTGLAVAVSTMVRTRGQLSAISAVGATALAMLGGCYWPIDILNDTMKTIAQLVPTGWAMSGLIDIVVRNQGAAQALLPSAVLLCMAAVFMTIGVWRLKLE